MSRHIEQIGEDKKFVCFGRRHIKWMKERNSRYRRRKWRQNPEVNIPKWNGWAG